MKAKKVLAVFLASTMAMSGSVLTAWADETVQAENAGIADETTEISQEAVNILSEELGEDAAGEVESDNAAVVQEAVFEEGTNDVAEPTMEIAEEGVGEEAEETAGEEDLLAAVEDAGKISITKENYAQKASGTDGKGGSWNWDGNGKLVLNNVSMDSLYIESGSVTVESIGENYFKDPIRGPFDKVGRLTLTGAGTLHIEHCNPYCIYYCPELLITDTHVDLKGMVETQSDITIRNSDVSMSYGYAGGGFETLAGNMKVENSNVLIRYNHDALNPASKYGGIGGNSIQLIGCSIVDTGLSVKTVDGKRQVICSDEDYGKGIYGFTDLSIKRNEVTQTTPHVSYRTHVQKDGWQGYVKDGAMSGTTGQSKRLEAINIQLTDVQGSGGIEYRTHVQKYGWQNWVKDNALAGTSGESKRLEAIQIRLTGDVAKQYDVYYQTHIQGFGWSGWASNGEMCGSAGYSRRLEGISIKLVKKGDPAPGSTANCYYLKAGSGEPVSKISGSLVGYNTHVQTYGWQNYAYDGAMAGTKGESKRLEGIHINLVDKPYSGDIVYRTHVQKYGWQGWKKNGEMSGTSGESKRLEGIQIYLTGEMAKHYDVYYRVHAQTYGWLDWAKNGAMAGTSGLSKRLEGINIVLVEKGGKAPGSTAKPNVVGTGGKLPDNPYKG